MLSWPTNGWRGIRTQKNSDRLCVVFNSDTSQFKSRSLHMGNHPLSKHVFIEIANTKKYIGGLWNASKCISFKVLHFNGSLRLRCRFVLHKMLSMPFIISCNLISSWICRRSKRLKNTLVESYLRHAQTIGYTYWLFIFLCATHFIETYCTSICARFLLFRQQIFILIDSET